MQIHAMTIRLNENYYKTSKYTDHNNNNWTLIICNCEHKAHSKSTDAKLNDNCTLGICAADFFIFWLRPSEGFCFLISCAIIWRECHQYGLMIFDSWMVKEQVIINGGLKRRLFKHESNYSTIGTKKMYQNYCHKEIHEKILRPKMKLMTKCNVIKVVSSKFKAT